ncbi:stage II sporulation protein M [Salinadaptatus halalkaliphilus]|uniref:Stage II sporulation protein M n=1 Tax=Salinadaptatus halalkaliphilus TaxID=2419781 RepID=A0A4S3TLX5_9EURY|nr:stage II sporulation protein M [Salinadaptatus halalkaliphilus]THE64600.1 stage II sporulation protein M [Salinadaptatus halalkaliphilus]
MSLSDSVAAVGAAFRRRPADFLPFYFLGAAIPAVVRVFPFVAIALSYVYLATTGRLEAFTEELTAIETEMPDPETEPEAFGDWLFEVSTAFEQILTPVVGLLLVSSILLFIVVYVVLDALVSATQLAACDGSLRDERGSVAGIAGFRQYGLQFLALYLLEIALWSAVFATVGIGTFVVAVVVGAASPLLAIPVVFLGLLFMLLLLAAIRALFAFAPVAVVVDDARTLESLSNTVGFVRGQPIDAAFYYALSVGSLLAISAVSGILALVDVVMTVSLLTIVVLFPALDLLKTALYSQYRGSLRPPATPERSVRSQFTRGCRRGWSEMVAFVRQTPLMHVAVVALGVVSFVGGWLAADPYTGVFPASIDARLESHIPPAAAIEFFGNNWFVAITTAFAGIALLIPALVSLVFNGVFIGAIARLETEPIELLAFIIPHGIVEIPAIFVASTLGIWLGLAWWRTYRGHADRESFADALERAFWVLIGVGLLLALAGFIEGFVSPYYFRLFL